MTHTIHAAEIWRGGRLLGPHRLEASDGRWTAVEPDRSSVAPDVALAVAGLVDLHVHAGPSPFAAATDAIVRSGVELSCSQGDAGWRNAPDWVSAIAAAGIDVRLALNLNPDGECGADGSLANASAADVDQLVEVGRQHPGIVRMVAVNLSPRSLGDGPALACLDLAVDAASRLGLPLLVGLATPAQAPLADQFDRLRPGDVVTYCYRSQPWCLFPDGAPLEPVVEARARGVLFDIGHGKTSFDPAVAASAIAAGFAPNTISSDFQFATAQLADPMTVGVTLRRVVAAGMPLDAALRAVTSTPANVLGVEVSELSDFRVGEPARIVDLFA